MNKNEKQSEISLNVFQVWKANQCTIALINLLKEAIKENKKAIYNAVIQHTKINIEYLNCLKGSLKENMDLLEIIQDKNSLSEFLLIKKEEKEEENNND